MRTFHRHDRDPVQTSGWTSKTGATRALLDDRGTAPVPVIDGHPAVEYLGGNRRALGYLHTRWVTYFGVALDDELGAGETVDAAAWRSWRRVAGEQPALARVLTWYCDDPAVRMADDRHRRMLSEVAGCDARRLPGFDTAGSSSSFAAAAAAG